MTTVVRAIAGYGLLGLLALWCPTPARAQADPVTPALIEQTAKTSFAEFFEMLALPNDAIKPEDIRKNADWLEAAFRKRGFATRQLLVLHDRGRPAATVRNRATRVQR